MSILDEDPALLRARLQARVQDAMLRADLAMPKPSEVGLHASLEAMLQFAQNLHHPPPEESDGPGL